MGGEAVAVVTDSTASLPTSLPVRVVPLRIDVGGRSLVDGVDARADDIAEALRHRERVTTSRPAPAEFAAAYAEALAAGAQQVVSVHLSARLSGTWDAARLAALDFPRDAVRVVDSRSTGAALGFAVAAAVEAAASGAGGAGVEDAAVRAGGATSTLLAVDSLEYLRRGGRIGSATTLLGTGLAIKPLLQVAGGQVVPLEKVRTSARARQRLADLAVLFAGDARVDVAVQHLAAPDAATWVAERVSAAVPELCTLQQSELGAVLGAHLGPGAVGVVVHRRP